MPLDPELTRPQYIGDGVYVRFDGFMLWLSTERDNGTHQIALEPEVYAGLRRYVQADPRVARHFSDVGRANGSAVT